MFRVLLFLILLRIHSIPQSCSAKLSSKGARVQLTTAQPCYQASPEHIKDKTLDKWALFGASQVPNSGGCTQL